VLHEAALEHASVHALQHALFVALGVNMWMPLFGPLPMPGWFGNFAKLGYIVGVRLLGALLANVPAVDRDAAVRRLRGRRPRRRPVGRRLADDGRGVAADARPVRLAVPARGPRGEERQALVELGADPARAARAVAAGRGCRVAIPVRHDGFTGGQGRGRT
jgi:hypothetical protein